MINSTTKNGKMSDKLNLLLKFSETISEKDLALFLEEVPGVEKLANYALTGKIKLSQKNFDDARIKVVPKILQDRFELSSDIELVKTFRSAKKLINMVDSGNDRSKITMKKLQKFAVDCLGMDPTYSFDLECIPAIKLIVVELLKRFPHATWKIYYDFNSNSLTSNPEKGDCILISTVSIGYNKGICHEITERMHNGKTFKEALIENLQKGLRKTYLKLSQLESFSFKEYNKRKIPLALVDRFSLVDNLERMNVSSINKLLKGRNLEDRLLIAEIIKDLIVDPPEELPF